MKEKLSEAQKFLRNYKKYFQLDDDDVQELMIKFHLHYDEDKGKISTFFVPIIHNHNKTKWAKKVSPKHAHTAIQIDKMTDEDNRDWLHAQIASNDEDYEIMTKEDEFKIILRKGMSVLNQKQADLIFSIYFEEISVKELCEEYGVTKQAIQQQIKVAINKMKKYYIKNNINVTF